MRSLSPWFIALILAALTVGAYLPVWQNDFVDFDDIPYLVENPAVKGGLTWETIRDVWKTDPGAAPYWMPITWMSFQFDAEFFSGRTPAGERILSPIAFHAQNLFWHTATVLLLFGFCLRLSGRKWPSFLIAALFALHPMHVESVAWAAERKDVLSAFFGVLTLWTYLRYVEKPHWARYAAVAASLVLSLLAKPMLITLPFVLLLLDFWPFQRLRWSRSTEATADGIPQRRLSLERLILEKMPLFLIVLLFALLTLATREQRGTLVSLHTISFSSRLANALTAYNWYLGTTFYPSPLAHLYPHPYENWSLTSAVTGAATLLVCTLLAWQQRQRRPWLLVGWLWFVGSLVPVLGFAQGGKQAWADRFSYWPHIGLFLALVWELANWVERVRIPALVYRFAGVAVLGGLACLTWAQVGTWRDTRTAWEHTVRVTRDNDQAHQHLGSYYHSQGQEELAEAHMMEAVRIQRRRILGDAARPFPSTMPPPATVSPPGQSGRANSPSPAPSKPRTDRF